MAVYGVNHPHPRYNRHWRHHHRAPRTHPIPNHDLQPNPQNQRNNLDPNRPHQNQQPREIGLPRLQHFQRHLRPVHPHMGNHAQNGRRLEQRWVPRTAQLRRLYRFQNRAGVHAPLPAVDLPTQDLNPERIVVSPDHPGSERTSFCPLFLEGRCHRGELCTYAHGNRDMVVGLPPRFGVRYKSRVCRAFAAKKLCIFGIRCWFLHDERAGDRCALFTTLGKCYFEGGGCPFKHA